MRATTIDLRDDKTPEVFLRLFRRCGLYCKSCKWVGSRLVYFYLNRGQRVDYISANNSIKGMRGSHCCCKCMNPLVVFTHIQGSQDLQG